MTLLNRTTANIAGAIVLVLIAAVVPLALEVPGQTLSNLGPGPAVLGFAIVGIVVTRHSPRQPMGWLLLGVACFFALNSDASLYAVLDYRLHKGWPLGWVAVLLQPAWAPAIVLSALSVLLFPDGRLPSRRMRWVVAAFLGIAAIWLVGAYVLAAAAILNHHVHIEPSGDLTAIDHPTGAGAVWGTAQQVFFPVLGASWLLWFVSQIPGYLRSTGERRLQLKWLLSGAFLFVVAGVLLMASSTSTSEFGRVASVGAVFGLAALPVSLGIGILKYRLYDIDRLISRTLSYAALTGLLALVFVGIVALCTDVLPFSSPVAVAASTLAAAALFDPLRRRVQRIVDRRFNRARYDTEAIVASFTARLRDAVDLDTVRGELLRAVDRAVEPAHASVWIRPSRSKVGA